MFVKLDWKWLLPLNNARRAEINTSLKGLVSALRNKVSDFQTSKSEKGREKLRERDVEIVIAIFPYLRQDIF